MGESLPPWHRSQFSAEDGDFVNIWGGKIGLQIVYGNRESAHELVDKAFAERNALNAPALLSLPLAELGLDNRTCNTLEQYADIRTVGDLLESNVAALLVIPNFGPNSIVSTFAKLASFSVQRVIELEGKQQ